MADLTVAKRPADASISAFFRARRFIGAKDRSAIAETVYDVLRNHAKLHWWLKYLTHSEQADARRLLMLYLSLVKKQAASTIGRLFDGEKYAPNFLDEAERKFLNDLTGRTLLHPQMDEAVALECPAWAYPQLKEHFGAALQAEMRAMLLPAPLDIRINPVKTTREAVLENLKAEGIKAAATPFSPLGIRVQGRPAISQLALYKDGSIEIQDEASQLVALLADVKPGQSVVDFCAGAGGKTLALAALMQNKGRVIACDVLGKRLEKAKLRFRRAGLHNIDTRELKNAHDQWVKHSAGKYDRVLVDAPCSGSGTWRRNPDARWNQLGPSLDELQGMQKDILASAARLVKTGGKLIYATCSILPQENQKQIEMFLDDHKDFTLAPAATLALGVEGLGNYLVLTPARHKTDGFFAAVMEKV